MEEPRIIARFPAGGISPPPSKSLSHRAIICAALAEPGDESVLSNIALSDDISATLSAVEALGASCARSGDTLRVRPRGKPAARHIDCAESGSTLRFLLPVAALSDAETAFTGRGRLLERPMDAYEAAFAQNNVTFTRAQDRITVRGPMRSGLFELPGDVSSQFVSGLLLALPLLDGDSEIRLTTPLESRQYVDLTLDTMKRFGVEVTAGGDSYHINGAQRYKAASYAVEADFSQAAYFLGAAALGCPVCCKGLNTGSLQGDRAILDVLRDMGAALEIDGDGVRVSADTLSAVTVDAREIPDLIPPIAVLCCFCEGTSRIVNAGRLRLKESDRLAAMAAELTKLGARVEETPDSLTIHGAPALRGGAVDAHGDHRIAMSMALAAIRCTGPVALTGSGHVQKSYPNFWLDFEKEARHV